MCVICLFNGRSTGTNSVDCYEMVGRMARMSGHAGQQRSTNSELNTLVGSHVVEERVPIDVVVLQRLHQRITGQPGDTGQTHRRPTGRSLGGKGEERVELSSSGGHSSQLSTGESVVLVDASVN